MQRHLFESAYEKPCSSKKATGKKSIETDNINDHNHTKAFTETKAEVEFNPIAKSPKVKKRKPTVKKGAIKGSTESSALAVMVANISRKKI